MARTAQALKIHLFAAALASFSGCVPSHGREIGFAAHDNRAILRVTNRGSDFVQVSLVRSGAAIPLGSVPGLSTRSFFLNGSQLGNGEELQLKAGTRADMSAFRSAVFSATVGQRIEWFIDRALASDVVIVR